MDFPTKNGDFHSYVSLPEGIAKWPTVQPEAEECAFVARAARGPVTSSPKQKLHISSSSCALFTRFTGMFGRL